MEITLKNVGHIDIGAGSGYRPIVPTEEEFHARLGKRIAELRRAAGVTQQELGNAVGLSRTSITNIENGRQSLQVYTLLLIAKHLRVSMHTLLPQDEVASWLPDNLEEPVRGWLTSLLKDEGKR